MDIVERRLEESYKHIKSSLNKEDKYVGESVKLLHEMCNACEYYCGKEHDYDRCRNKPCFKLFLGHEYMAWDASWS